MATDLELIINKYVSDHPEESNIINMYNPTILVKALRLVRKIPTIIPLIKEHIIASNCDELNQIRMDGATTLMIMASSSIFYEIEDLLQLLINTGIDLNICDNLGISAIMYAALESGGSSSEKTVQILINAGADLNIQNKDGCTALMLASLNCGKNSRTINGDKNISTENTVKMLLEAGANPNLKCIKGWTALMIASRYFLTCSTENTIRILLDAGADVNLQNNYGSSALMLNVIYGCSWSSSDIVRTESVIDMIINAGADLNLMTNYGCTVFDLFIIEILKDTDIENYLNNIIFRLFIKKNAKINYHHHTFKIKKMVRMCRKDIKRTEFKIECVSLRKINDELIIKLKEYSSTENFIMIKNNINLITSKPTTINKKRRSVQKLKETNTYLNIELEYYPGSSSVKNIQKHFDHAKFNY